MSKLKLDSRSLTDAMQKNPDFIPTLVASLNAAGAGEATAPLSLNALAEVGEQLVVTSDDAGEQLVSATDLLGDEASLAPSELRASVEQQRHEAMMANALS
tara:strand:- start:144 stop:446 length:303 start_codon:yes stop_codon:yes gene_type:complete